MVDRFTSSCDEEKMRRQVLGKYIHWIWNKLNLTDFTFQIKTNEKRAWGFLTTHTLRPIKKKSALLKCTRSYMASGSPHPLGPADGALQPEQPGVAGPGGGTCSNSHINTQSYLLQYNIKALAKSSTLSACFIKKKKKNTNFTVYQRQKLLKKKKKK
uniref:Uncharacterized protein n=1 Tax=Amphiprion percula TaxID=161767 RepID=A0A3P8RJQ6_AMPPE